MTMIRKKQTYRGDAEESKGRNTGKSAGATKSYSAAEGASTPAHAENAFTGDPGAAIHRPS